MIACCIPTNSVQSLLDETRRQVPRLLLSIWSVFSSDNFPYFGDRVEWLIFAVSANAQGHLYALGYSNLNHSFHLVPVTLMSQSAMSNSNANFILLVAVRFGGEAFFYGTFSASTGETS